MDDGLKSLLKEVVSTRYSCTSSFPILQQRQREPPLTKTADGSLTAAQVMLDTRYVEVLFRALLIEAVA